MDKKKIIIYGKHFANIDSEFYKKFEETLNVKNFTGWIKEQVLNDFRIDIKGSNDVEEIDKVLSQYYYQDKREWLAEKMRNMLKTVEYKHKTANEVICYRFLNQDKEYVNSPVLTKEFINEFLKSKSILVRCEKNYLGIQDTNGSIPDVLQRWILSFEFPMTRPYYLRLDEYEFVKECVKGTEFESKLVKP